jgi:hypothetical protein
MSFVDPFTLQGVSFESNVFTEHSQDGNDIRTSWTEAIPMEKCGSDKGVLTLLSMFYKAAVLVSAVYFVCATRDVKTEIVDHRKLVLCVYQIALVTLVMMAMEILLVDDDAQASTALWRNAL